MPPTLLSLLANTPADLVRVISEFMGEGFEEEETNHKEERLELKRRKNAELEREVAALKVADAEKSGEIAAWKVADAGKSSDNAAQREEITAQREEIAAMRRKLEGGDGDGGSAKGKR